jgi:hypothetical protein
VFLWQALHESHSIIIGLNLITFIFLHCYKEMIIFSVGYENAAHLESLLCAISVRQQGSVDSMEKT